MKHLMLFMAVVCCAVAFGPTSAEAAPISFTHTGAGSGTLDGVAFTDRAFTITAVGDTGNRDFFSIAFSIDHDKASIDIAGLGALNFVTGTRTFVNNGQSIVGFSRSTSSDLYNGPRDSVFGTWDMLSSIGPIPGSGRLLQWTLSPVQTDQGVLVFNDALDIAATFQAVVGSPGIPAPGAILLGTLGTGLVGWLRRRKTL